MCRRASSRVVCSIIPPHILRCLAERGDQRQRDLAFRTLGFSAHLRGQRQVLTSVSFLGTTPTGVKRRTVYTAGNAMSLPGSLVRGEGAAATGDPAADEAYDGAGTAYDFFQAAFNRNSLDDRGLRLDSTVHFGNGYDNAHWNGQQMLYGDGDGTVFKRFTASLDVIGHELTHGITQYEAELNYQGQSGALNEHFSDVFGSLLKQYVAKQTAAQADWLIGRELLEPTVKGVAVRSLKAPGTAYDDPLLGVDPQPDHMKKFVQTEDDNGGVHINSGIPNKAFYNFATGLGGNAWDRPGRIWYVTLCNELSSNATFQDCADKTFKVAKDLYGAAVAKEVRSAWKGVGITVQAVTVSGAAATQTPANKPAAKPAPKQAPAKQKAPAKTTKKAKKK
ncbi:MAG TPA: M4 family metallopeptidase [Thermoanaerobaculia bacterium]|nr:M4 family metallopeptidase [Thermoanaerobaculia bacterium]